MNCKYCSAPIPEGEHLCPSCGKEQEEIPESAVPCTEETDNPSDAQKAAEASENSPCSTDDCAGEGKPKKKCKWLWAAVAVVAVAAAVSSYFVWGTQNSPHNTAQVPTRTMISYSTSRALKTAAEGDIPLPLFVNDAYSLPAFTSIDQLMQQSPVYVGAQNFVELENELVYVDTVLQSVDTSTGQPTALHNLYSIDRQGNGQPVLLDSNIQAIQASGKNFVYYNKVVDRQIMQYRYANGEIAPVNESLGVDHAIITSCSADGEVFAFRGANNAEDGTMETVNGYMANGTVHLLEPTATAYYVSKDGKTIYITDVANSPAPALYYVSDLAAGTLEQITPYMTELIIYEDTGSVAYIGGREIGQEEVNPSCSLGYFDAAAKTSHIIAEDAVAIVEASPKSYAWLNESSQEMIITELSTNVAVEKAVCVGQFHYINSNGDFIAADANGNTFTIAEGFYTPESYALKDTLYYLTFQNGAFLWNDNDTVYKYTAGSMTAPQSIQLDTPLSEKLNGSLQVGYFMDGSGNLIEQTENTLVKKSFENDSTTSVYDSPSAFVLVGMNNTGDTLYFITSDSSLYAKSLNDTSNPKPLASQVHSAAAVTDGLYVLREYGANGGRLEFCPWGETTFTLVDTGVTSLTDIVLG